eukprot:scaffold419780_cov50-Prasinocladus_malaysianus.AAC.1
MSIAKGKVQRGCSYISNFTCNDFCIALSGRAIGKALWGLMQSKNPRQSSLPFAYPAATCCYAYGWWQQST